MYSVRQTTEFSDWMTGLKDRVARSRVQVRVSRLAEGNPGQHRVLTDGVVELKIDYGPGYRLYYTVREQIVVILLCGGDKGSQTRDIKLAKQLARGL